MIDHYTPQVSEACHDMVEQCVGHTCSLKETLRGIPVHARVGIPAVGIHTAGIPSPVLQIREVLTNTASVVIKPG